MAVYFIHDEKNNAVKIGYSQNPVTRLVSIQVGFPYPLKLIKVIETDNDARTEKELHNKFTDYKIQGEWFSLTGALQDYMDGKELLDDSIRCEGFLEQFKENCWKVWVRFYRYCPPSYGGMFCKPYYSKRLWNVTEQEAKDVLAEKLKLFETQDARYAYITSSNTLQTLRELYEAQEKQNNLSNL